MPATGVLHFLSYLMHLKARNPSKAVENSFYEFPFRFEVRW